MRSLGVYKSYNFKNKDPAIDELRTVIKDEGASYLQIQEASGVSSGTMYNWFHGQTRRPQHASIMAVARALGYDYQLVKEGKSLIVAKAKKKNGSGK